MDEVQSVEVSATLRAILEVRFEREGLYPENVPLTVLSEALAAIHQLSAGKEADEGDEDEDVGPFQLLDVTRGSAVYAFAGHSPGPAIERIRRAGLSLVRPAEEGEAPEILRPIEALSHIARRLRCIIRIHEPGLNDQPLARIDEDSFRAIEGSMFIRGESVLSGRVMRVGGATRRKCSLRLPGRQKLLYCHIADADVARKLGNALYREVQVRGVATWIKRTWEVYSFEIMSVRRMRPQNLLDAVQSLYDAGGKAWDSVEDPEAEIRAHRGEE